MYEDDRPGRAMPPWGEDPICVAWVPRMNRRLIVLLATAGVLSFAAIVIGLIGLSKSSNSSAEPPAASVKSSRFDGSLLPPGVKAPDFSLKDENGKRVTMRQYRGKVVIVTFLYSHCRDTCPVQAQQIKGALDELGHDVPALAISVDPPGDTPKSVQHFNRKMEMTGRLRWVLGGVTPLRRLWRGFAVTPQTDAQEHMARFVLIDRRGLQRVGFPAHLTTPEHLAHDIRALEREPS
jgi:protein SCO1/2